MNFDQKLLSVWYSKINRGSTPIPNRFLPNIDKASIYHKGRRKTKKGNEGIAYMALLAGGTVSWK